MKIFSVELCTSSLLQAFNAHFARDSAQSLPVSEIHGHVIIKSPIYDRMRRLKELIVGTRYERLNTQEHVTSSRGGLLSWHPHSQLEAWNPELWIPILSYIPNNLLSYSLSPSPTNYRLKLTSVGSGWEVELVVKFGHRIGCWIGCWLVILTGSQLWHWSLPPLRIWSER